MNNKKILENDELEIKEKITYKDLMQAKTITFDHKKDSLSHITIIKCVAVTIVLFVIIICSFILFRGM